MKDRIDELLGLIEVEPDQLRAAELLNTQAVLSTLIGKTVVSAEVEEKRIAVTTSDGCRFYFYGLLGIEEPN
jgi:hypothetical protein